MSRMILHSAKTTALSLRDLCLLPAYLKRFLPWVDLMNAVVDEQNWIKVQASKWKEGSQFVYAIFLAHDETYLGNIDAHAIDWKHHKVDIGYWLTKRHEGHGYMTEAVLALEYALFEVGFHRVVIQCNVKNTRSARVALRCGYRLEGILRQNAIEGGRFRDTMVLEK